MGYSMQDFTVFIANHMGLFYALGAILIALMLIEFLRSKRSSFHVGPTEAVQLINRHNAVVIDIRPEETYGKGHIVDSVCIPAHELSSATKKLDKYKGKPVILVCNTGMQTQKIAASLKKQGYTAFSLSGGMRAWSDAQLPLVKE